MQTTERQRPIGFVGLGAMGAGQAANLTAKADRDVLVFDRDASRQAAIVEAGARGADGLAELGRECAVVFLSLPGDAEANAVLIGQDGLLTSGTPIVVNLGTVSMRATEDLAAFCEAHGASYVDAPVARGVEGARAGTLSMTVGASPEVFAAIEPYLRAMATDIVHCGPAGAGALVKLANNMIVTETVVAAAEMLALIRRSGLVDPQVAVAALEAGSAGSFVMSNHIRRHMLTGHHGTDKFPSRYMAKDVGYVREYAADIGIGLPQAAVAAELLAAAIEAGHGDEYFTSVIEVLDGPNDRHVPVSEEGERP